MWSEVCKHREEACFARLPFICLVVGVLLAAPSTYQAEEHSGSLIVSVSQKTFVILITGSHGLPLITLHFTLHLGIALGKMDIFTISALLIQMQVVAASTVFFNLLL